MTVEGMDFHKCLNFQRLFTVPRDSDWACLRESKSATDLRLPRGRESWAGMDWSLGFRSKPLRVQNSTNNKPHRTAQETVYIPRDKP